MYDESAAERLQRHESGNLPSSQYLSFRTQSTQNLTIHIVCVMSSIYDESRADRLPFLSSDSSSPPRRLELQGKPLHICMIDDVDKGQPAHSEHALPLFATSRPPSRYPPITAIQETSPFFQDDKPPPEAKSSRQFSIFPNLPLEIRLKIWRITFPPPRYYILSVHCYPTAEISRNLSKLSSYEKQSVPVSLSINRESRAETLKHYSVFVCANVSQSKTKKVPARDVVYLLWEECAIPSASVGDPIDLWMPNLGIKFNRSGAFLLAVRNLVLELEDRAADEEFAFLTDGPDGSERHYSTVEKICCALLMFPKLDVLILRSAAAEWIGQAGMEDLNGRVRDAVDARGGLFAGVCVPVVVCGVCVPVVVCEHRGCGELCPCGEGSWMNLY